MSRADRNPYRSMREAEPEEVWNLIRSIRFVMFTSRDAGGLLQSRPMTVQSVAQDDEDLWFFMSRASNLVEQLAADPMVNVAYADTSADVYASLAGEASVVEDAALKDRLFSALARVWFPGGPADPDLALVRVSMRSVEYWIVRENKLVQMLKMARAAATGTPPDIGEHGTLTA
jgi:general stress protein 26